LKLLYQLAASEKSHWTTHFANPVTLFSTLYNIDICIGDERAWGSYFQSHKNSFFTILLASCEPIANKTLWYPPPKHFRCKERCAQETTSTCKLKVIGNLKG